MPTRDAKISFDIWYPADPGGSVDTVGGNGVFFGTQAGKGAPHRAGKFPVVLVSHGSGGNGGQFGWIAEQLAEKGFVVVLPNQPREMTLHATAVSAAQIWKRPADMRAVLDAIVGAPDEFDYMDTSRIGILGFSAGGYTALAVAGARVDDRLLSSFYDGQETGMSDCAFFATARVDLHDLDLTPARQDHRDPRIKTAVVVDLGVVQTMNPESLAAIDLPMLVINLGPLEDVPIGVRADGSAALIPQAALHLEPDAIHFSFMAECKPKGPKILQDEGKFDPLCDDAGGRTRSEIHATLAELTIAFLESTLAG